MKIALYLFLCGCFFLIIACNNNRVSKQETASLNYCKIIDTIICNYEHKFSNQYMTDNLSLLVNKTGIPDHSVKGFAGCIHQSDSIFHSDMRKFRAALKCQSK